MFPDVLCHPVAEKHIEQPLVASVEGSLFIGQAQQRLEGIHRGPVYEDSRVEAVRPSGVRGCRELLPIKEFVTVSYNLKVWKELVLITAGLKRFICFYIPVYRHPGIHTWSTL